MWRGHLAPQGVCYEIDMPRAPGSPRQRWGGGTHLGCPACLRGWALPHLTGPWEQSILGILNHKIALFCGASEAVGHFRMKLNISFPATGCQQLIEVDDEQKLRTFYEKRMATEVAADALGEEWKGYVVRISGGNDKQGFPMKQGVLTHGRVRLLLSKGHSCYRPRRTGERKHKSVRVALWMPI